MKNNQFKKEVKKLIENQCKKYKYVSVYLDESKNSRIIYIYNACWDYMGIFGFWFTKDNVHLQFTNLRTVPLIVHKVKNVDVKYTDFDMIVDAIGQCFEIMVRTEG